MAFRVKADTAAAQTADAGKIRLGGGFRLPAATVDAGKIRLGAAFACRSPRPSPVQNRTSGQHLAIDAV
jgi:hypothetical protein